MMPSLPCESTQKMLSNDIHIIYYQKGHFHMTHAPVTHASIEMYSKNDANDVHIV